jgi:hypothetical protein
MVKAYYGEPGEDMAEAFHKMIEMDTGRKISTLKILHDYGNADEGIDVLIVFEDYSIIKGNVCFPKETFNGMIGLKFQGNLL